MPGGRTLPVIADAFLVGIVVGPTLSATSSVGRRQVHV
jgi:hypothetical protein